MSEFYQWKIWRIQDGYKLTGGVSELIDWRNTPKEQSYLQHIGTFMSREQLSFGQWLLDEIAAHLEVQPTPGSKITWDVLNLKEKLYTIVTTEL